MAARFFVVGGVDTNWSTTGNWSTTSGGAGGSAVPTASDDVTLDANSGSACVLNTATAKVALSFTCTNFTGTATFNVTLTVSGAITLGTNVTWAGSSALIGQTTATHTSNTATLGVPLTLNGTATHTLADVWTVSELVTLGGTTLTTTLNSQTLNCQKGLTTGGSTAIVTGTTLVKLTGTGTWQGPTSTGALRNNLTIAAGANTVTVSGTVRYNTGTLTYTSGTMTVTGSTLSMGVATTLETSGMTWEGITVSASVTITLSSNLNWSGTLTHSLGAAVYSGAFTLNGGAWTISGGSTGTNTIGGVVTLTGALTMSNTTSTTFSGAFAITADSATISGSQTITLVANVTITNLTTSSDANVINGAFNWNTGGLTTTGEISGTTTVVFSGTGTWTGAAGALKNTASINTAGTLTLSGTILYNTGTLTYTAGTISAGSSTLSMSLATTLNTSGMTWANVTISANVTITLSSNLNISGTLLESLGACTFTGAFNISTGAWTISGAGAGTTTLSGTVTGTGAFTLSNTTSTTFVGAFAITMDSASISGAQILTLVNDITITNLTDNTTATTINGAFNWKTGGLTMTGGLSGTSTIVFAGTGTWSGSAAIKNSATVNTAGTLTISGGVAYDTGTFTYTAGTVTSTGSTVTVALAATFNTSGMTWASMSITAAITVTINSVLVLSGTLTLPNAAVTFAGSSGFTVANLTNTSLTLTRIFTFAAGKTYTITTDWSNVGTTSAIKQTIKSSVGGTKALITLQSGATHDLAYADPTDIDSSGGQKIFSYKGTITTTTNWTTQVRDLIFGIIAVQRINLIRRPHVLHY